MNKYLGEALSELKNNFLERESDNRELHAQSLDEQTNLTKEIKVLDRQLREIKKKQRHYEEERAALLEEQSLRTFALVKNSLEQSSQSIAASSSYLEKKMKIEAAHRILVENNPTLEEEYRDYIDMEARRDTLSASYIRFHKQQKNRLANLIKLKRVEGELSLEKNVYIQFAMAIDSKEETVYWLLPYPEEDQLPIQSREEIGDAVLESLANAVIHLATNADWYLLDISLDLAWLSFPAIATPYEYQGDESPEQSARNTFHDYLATESIFRGCDLEVDIGLISLDTWIKGQLDQPVETPTPPIPPETQEIEHAVEDLTTLGERSDGIYTEEDIVSWQRPLRTSEESLWNVQGRRLRTLLISMLSKGFVDNTGIPKIRLHQPLPQPHRARLEHGVEQLISNEVLIERSSNGEAKSYITINPARLDDVQALINRYITELWMTIIQE